MTTPSGHQEKIPEARQRLGDQKTNNKRADIRYEVQLSAQHERWQAHDRQRPGQQRLQSGGERWHPMDGGWSDRWLRSQRPARAAAR